jgi:hypothetical protein
MALDEGCALTRGGVRSTLLMKPIVTRKMIARRKMREAADERIVDSSYRAMKDAVQ